MSAVGSLASRDRAVVYRGLARLFRRPQPALVDELGARDLPDLRAALRRLGTGDDAERAACEVAALVADADVSRLERAWHETFDPSAGLRCPPNETSYTTDVPEKAARRTYELADVAGFYRAFGVEVAEGTERPDHVMAELEFMHLLAVKDAMACEAGDGAERIAICRDAARKFLSDHLGRWAQRFAAGLQDAAQDPLYAAAGRLLARFVARDADWLGADPTSAAGGREDWAADEREA